MVSIPANGANLGSVSNITLPPDGIRFLVCISTQAYLPGTIGYGTLTITGVFGVCPPSATSGTKSIYFSMSYIVDNLS